jgi:hypothetical protein
MLWNTLECEHLTEFFRKFKYFKGLTDKAISRRLGGVIPPSTLNHLLATARGFTLDRAFALAEVVSQDYPCSSAAILQYLADEDNPCPPI